MLRLFSRHKQRLIISLIQTSKPLNSNHLVTKSGGCGDAEGTIGQGRWKGQRNLVRSEERLA